MLAERKRFLNTLPHNHPHLDDYALGYSRQVDTLVTAVAKAGDQDDIDLVTAYLNSGLL